MVSSLTTCQVYVPLRDQWNPAWTLFLEHFGGTVALPFVRGGDELGHEWRVNGSQYGMVSPQ